MSERNQTDLLSESDQAIFSYLDEMLCDPSQATPCPEEAEDNVADKAADKTPEKAAEPAVELAVEKAEPVAKQPEPIDSKNETASTPKINGVAAESQPHQKESAAAVNTSARVASASTPFEPAITRNSATSYTNNKPETQARNTTEVLKQLGFKEPDTTPKVLSSTLLSVSTLHQQQTREKEVKTPVVVPQKAVVETKPVAKVEAPTVAPVTVVPVKAPVVAPVAPVVAPTVAPTVAPAIVKPAVAPAPVIAPVVEAKAPAVKAPVIKVPEPVVAPPEIEKEIEIEPAPISSWCANGRPTWAQKRFECLMFTVAGLKMAVPLVSLGTIYPIDRQFNHLPGQGDWFVGILRSGSGNIKVLDTARCVMPERYNASCREGLNYVITLHGYKWGIACHDVARSVTLEIDDVKWRTDRGKRPWLAGTVVDHMCALIDTEGFQEFIAAAERSR